jgi:hypothetical protein
MLDFLHALDQCEPGSVLQEVRFAEKMAINIKDKKIDLPHLKLVETKFDL